MARGQRTLRERGQEALRKNNFEYALKLYLQYLANNPGDVDARKELRAAEMQRRKGKKGSLLEPLLSLPGMVHLAFLKMMRKHETIIRKCERMLASNPLSLALNVTLAQAAEEAGYPDVAIFSYHVALEENSKSEPTLRSLAGAYREVGDVSKAIETYQALLRVKPDDDEARKAVRDLSAEKSMDGWAEKELVETPKEGGEPEAAKEPKSASEVLKKELAASPDDKDVLLRMVGVLMGERKHSEAASALEGFISKHGGDFELKSRLGELRLREYEDEIKRWEEELKKSPANEGAKERLKRVKGKYNALAIEECKRKLEHYPTDMNLAFKLGELYYEAGQTDKATSQFQRSVKSAKLATKSYEMMGLCFIRKRIYELAADQFKKALAASKESSIGETAKRLNYWLGRTYELMDDKKTAREFYLKVYEADIQYRDVGDKMEELGIVHEGDGENLKLEES